MTASRILRAVGIAACCALLGACGDGQNAGLLTVNAPAGATGFTADRLSIELREHSTQESTTVQADLGGKPIAWPATVSFTFSSSVKGYVDVTVKAYNGATEIAEGSGSGGPIKSGGVTELGVTLKEIALTPPDLGAHD